MKLKIIPACRICGNPHNIFRCAICDADYCLLHISPWRPNNEPGAICYHCLDKHTKPPNPKILKSENAPLYSVGRKRLKSKR